MGKVYLIGAGPGDPDLLTVKAARLLERATIVLHDSLVSREVLQLIPREAEIIDVGKRCGQKLLTQDEINQLLISCATQSRSGRSLDRYSAGPSDLSTTHNEVIRLKGGDPVVFGRAGEEIEALLRANIPFEIVPGITAALGAAAAAGISLTDRRAASQIVITTYSRGSDRGAADPFAVTPHLDWAAISSSTTLVLYMPGADYAEVSRRLIEAGQPEHSPVRNRLQRHHPAATNPLDNGIGPGERSETPSPSVTNRRSRSEPRNPGNRRHPWIANRKEPQVKRATIS